VEHEFIETEGEPELTYVEALQKYTIVPVRGELEPEEYERLFLMPREEQQWRISFLVSIVKSGLHVDCDKIGLEEYRKFLFMTREEQPQWREKLSKLQKSHEDAEQEADFRTARWDERTVSMELKMLPAVREAAKQIATAHGMTAQEYVEKLLVESLKTNRNQVEEGKKRLERFKGSTVAAKRHTQEEELARLRALQKSSTRTPLR